MSSTEGQADQCIRGPDWHPNAKIKRTSVTIETRDKAGFLGQLSSLVEGIKKSVDDEAAITVKETKDKDQLDRFYKSQPGGLNFSHEEDPRRDRPNKRTVSMGHVDSSKHQGAFSFLNTKK